MTRGDNITLIGMPGAGKSTLGVVLAKQLGMGFVDTDLLIQEWDGSSLADIIAESGAEVFKELEERVILQLECSNRVIATGGSAVYGTDAMRHLHELGTVVYLQIGFDELNERLGDTVEARGVVMDDKESLRDLYIERTMLYEHQADVTVLVDGLTIREAVDAIERALAAKGVL